MHVRVVLPEVGDEPSAVDTQPGRETTTKAWAAEDRHVVSARPYTAVLLFDASAIIRGKAPDMPQSSPDIALGVVGYGRAADVRQPVGRPDNRDSRRPSPVPSRTLAEACTSPRMSWRC